MDNRPLGFAVRCINVDDAGRIGTAPWPVIGGISPELTGLGAPAAGIKHRHGRFIGEQFGPLPELAKEPFVQWTQVPRGMADPVCQRRTIQIDALAGVDLGLPVQRQVVGIFRHQDLSHRGLGRQSALDQPRRSWRLHDAVLAGSAGVFGPPSDENPELRRHQV